MRWEEENTFESFIPNDDVLKHTRLRMRNTWESIEDEERSSRVWIYVNRAFRSFFSRHHFNFFSCALSFYWIEKFMHPFQHLIFSIRSVSCSAVNRLNGGGNAIKKTISLRQRAYGYCICIQIPLFSSSCSSCSLFARLVHVPAASNMKKT